MDVAAAPPVPPPAPTALMPLFARAAPMLKTRTTCRTSAVAPPLSTVTACCSTLVRSRLPTALAGPVWTLAGPPPVPPPGVGDVSVTSIWLLPVVATETAMPVTETACSPVATGPAGVDPAPAPSVAAAAAVGSVVARRHVGLAAAALSVRRCRIDRCGDPRRADARAVAPAGGEGSTRWWPARWPRRRSRRRGDGVVRSGGRRLLGPPHGAAAEVTASCGAAGLVIRSPPRPWRR